MKLASILLLGLALSVPSAMAAKGKGKKQKETTVFDDVAIEPTDVYKFLDRLGIVSSVPNSVLNDLQNNPNGCKLLVDIVVTAQRLGVDDKVKLVEIVGRVAEVSKLGDSAMRDMKDRIEKEFLVEAFDLPKDALNLPSPTDILSVLAGEQLGLPIDTQKPETWIEATTQGAGNYVQTQARQAQNTAQNSTQNSAGNPSTTTQTGRERPERPERPTTDTGRVDRPAASGTGAATAGTGSTTSGSGSASMEITGVTYDKDLDKGETTVTATYVITYSDGTKETKTEVVGKEDSNGKSYNYSYGSGDKKTECNSCAVSPKPGEKYPVQDDKQAAKDAKDTTPNPMNDRAPSISAWATFKGKNGSILLPISKRGVKDPSPMTDAGPVRTLWAVARGKVFWDVQVRRGAFDPSPISDSGLVGKQVKFSGIPVKLGVAVDRPIIKGTQNIDPKKLIKPFAKNIVPVSSSPSALKVAASLKQLIGSADLPAGSKVQLVLAGGRLQSIGPAAGTQLSSADAQKLQGAVSKWAPPAGESGTFEFQLTDKP